MTYLWLRGPHRIMLAFLLALYLAIAITAWKVALPVLGVIVLVTMFRRAGRAKSNRAGATSLLELYRLSPEHFEQRVMSILAANGWHRLRWVGGTNDMGADVTGIDPSGRLCVVQAKRYRPGTNVGSPTVQTLIGSMVIYNAEHAVLVTTGSFTADAIRIAERMDVELIDGVGLVGMAKVSQRNATMGG